MCSQFSPHDVDSGEENKKLGVRIVGKKEEGAGDHHFDFF